MSNNDGQGIELRRLIRRQHGIVSLEQAKAAGYSRQMVAYKVATKAWSPSRRTGAPVRGTASTSCAG